MDSLAGKWLRKGWLLACTLVLVMSMAGPGLAAQATAKNVIVLIPDGVSFEQYTLTRWFKGEPLATDEILVGAVKTYIADSVVADSAPTASAYATGHRTADKFISVSTKADGLLPNVPVPAPNQDYRPLATVLEAAKLSGRSVGVVATARISHATPAAFVAHSSHRERENDLMEQAVYQNIDLAFGGGGRHLVAPEAGSANPYQEILADDPHSEQWAPKGKRLDKEDLLSVLRGRGYQVITTREELATLKSGKVFGMFSLSHMSPEIDRPEFTPEEPSLLDMTRKAMELLSANPKGFFLMVEGSQVDWADHANDPAHLLSDMMIFDQAVEAALDFAKNDGQTLVMVMPDHNTGGMTIGNYGTSESYSQTKLDKLLEPLKKMKLSSYGLVSKIGEDRTPEKVKSVVKDFWGLDITDDEANLILAKMAENKNDPNYAFGEVLSPKYTYLGWTTHGHCGGDVPLAAYGPGRPTGLLDGPQVALVTAEALGLDLEQTTQRLFVEANQAFAGGQVVVDESDPENLVVKVNYEGREAELPVNKNLIRVSGQTRELEGVVVYIPETKKAYVPMQAVEILKAAQQSASAEA